MTDNYIEEADSFFNDERRESQTFEEFIESFLENPKQQSRTAHQYIIDAIEYFGKRTVIEGGEEMERWRFFDDPANDGENAVIGNTGTLNQLVNDIRQMANNPNSETNRLIWINGPVATGKSELKRCFISGLKHYSQTEEGRRHTVEWNLETRNQTESHITYGDGQTSETDNIESWNQSPIQAHPLSVFPEEIQKEILEDVDLDETHTPYETDPFSKEAFKKLHQSYRDNNNTFSKATQKRHLRVIPQEMGIGNGIGLLHAEDDGTPKERLIGQWMPELLSALDSRGRKNPQAFSYDGVLSQGNRGITIIEEASQHADLLKNLLNIPEEGFVKIDKKIPMQIDTAIFLISNRDLEQQLEQHSQKEADPLKGVKRRMNRYDFTYLLQPSLEYALLTRELFNENIVPNGYNQDEIRQSRNYNGKFFAPHAIEAAVLADVCSRLRGNVDELDDVETTRLLDRGYHITEDGEQIDSDDYDMTSIDEPVTGIPITFTRDLLATASGENVERMKHLPKTDKQQFVATDILELIESKADEAPVINNYSAVKNALNVVQKHIMNEQKEDVINSIFYDKEASPESIRTYCEEIVKWFNDEDVDELKMKEFETTYLRKDESQYDGTEPNEEIKEEREQLHSKINTYQWEHRNQNDELQYEEIDKFQKLLGSYNWDEIKNEHEEIDFSQWKNPKNTVTQEVKEKCISNMVEHFGYSEQTAELVSYQVIKNEENI